MYVARRGLLFVVLSFFTNPIWAQELPDDLNYPKHRQIYESAKSHSDALRSQANQAQKQLEAARNEVRDLELDIEQAYSQIGENEGRIDQLYDEIDELEVENERTEAAIDELLVQSRALQEDMAQRSRERDALAGEERRLEFERRRIAQELSQLTQRLNQVRERHLQLRNTFEAARERARHLEERISNGEARLAELGREIQQVESRLPQVHQNLNNVQQQIERIRERERNLERQVAAEQGKLKPLQDKVQEAKAEQSRARAKVDAIQREAEPYSRRLNEADQAIKKAQGDLSRYTQEGDNLRQQRSRTESNLNSARRELEQAAREETEANDNLGRLQNDISEKEKRVEANKAEMNAIRERYGNNPKNIPPEEQKRITELNGENHRLINEIRAARIQVNSLEQVVQTAARKKQQAERSIPQLEQSLRSIDNQISQNESNIKSAQNNLRAAQEQKSQVEREMGDLHTRLQTAQSELNQTTGRVNAAEQELARASGALRDVQQQLATARDERAAKEREAENLRIRISELERTLPELRQNKQRLEANVAEARRDLPGARSEAQRLRERLENSERELNKVADDHRYTQRELERAEADLQYVVDQRLALSREIERLDADIRLLHARVNELCNIVDGNLSRITGSRQDIENLRAYNKQLHNEIATWEQMLPAKRDAVARAQENYLEKDKNAREAERITAQKYEEMNRVKERYDVLVAQAEADGRAQGSSAGREAGKTQGLAEGRKAGKEDGEIKGKEDGLQAGYENGRADGLNKGKEEGYKAGLEAPENYDEGFQAGVIQGEADALQEAKATEFPRGKSDKKAELLRALPQKVVELVNNVAAGFLGLVNSQPESVLIAAGAQDIVFASVDVAGEFFADDGFAFSSQHVCRNLNTGGVHTNVRIGQAKCEYPYTVIRQACESAYSSVYVTEYRSSYSAVYSEGHYATCVGAYDSAYAANEGVRYQEGYDAAYASAYKEWNAKGAEDARNKGFIDGKEKAYRDHIVRFKQEQYRLGQEEMAKYFAQNPVVQLLDAELLKTSEGHASTIVAGDILSLKLHLANFGGADAQAGTAQVKLIPLTSNVTVSAGQQWLPVTGLPKETIARVRDIAEVRIKESTGAETVSLRADVQFPDGTKAERVISLQTVPHVTVDVDDIEDLDVNPKINKKVKLKIKFVNTSRYEPTEDLQVRLETAPDVPAGWVSIGTSRDTISKKKFSPGKKSDNVKLDFEVVSSAARGRKLQLILTVLYKGNVSMKKAISVTPR